MADDIELVCGLVADSVARGEELEDVLRILLPYARTGRSGVVVDAETRCRVRAASDPAWVRAHLVLRHAIGTGLFGPVNGPESERHVHASNAVSPTGQPTGLPAR